MRLEEKMPKKRMASIKRWGKNMHRIKKTSLCIINSKDQSNLFQLHLIQELSPSFFMYRLTVMTFEAYCDHLLFNMTPSVFNDGCKVCILSFYKHYFLLCCCLIKRNQNFFTGSCYSI